MLSRVGAAVHPMPHDKKALLTAREALGMATRGGAKVLGREDIGALEVGKCADFIAIRLDQISYAGGLHDPLASLVFCHPSQVDYNYVHGRAVVSEGRLVSMEMTPLIEAHNRASKRLVQGG